MALYSYVAFSKDGKKIEGTIDAGSVAAVKEQLMKTGHFPSKISLVTSPGAQKSSLFAGFFGPRITLKDKVFFTKQLAVLLKAGVPLLDALELLIEQSEKGLRTIVIELKDGVKEGQSLADGLAKFPKIFDTTYVQLVRAGEASGSLEKILDRLTVYLERSQDLRKKIRGAMMLPLIQLFIVAAVVVILLTVVIPQIATAFEGENLTLPLPTRMLMGMSDFLIDHFIAIFVTIAILTGIFFWWKSTPAGARMWDAFVLKLPLIGHFARMSAVVQFCRTLGMLIEGGVNLAEALTIVTKIVENKVLVDTLNAARENIIKQGKIAEYLKQTKLFPAVAIYLISTGEQSGQLDKMLLTVAETYEAELRDLADNLSSVLNAAMPVVIGGVIGFVVFAIVKPIMGLGDAASAAAQLSKVS